MLVLNKHTATLSQIKNAVYIGRGSKWGNPFRIDVHGDRGLVIDRYELWLCQQKDLLQSLEELRGYDLLCYCAPKPCHGDLLLRLANASIEERMTWWRGLRDSKESVNSKYVRHAIHYGIGK